MPLGGGTECIMNLTMNIGDLTKRFGISDAAKICKEAGFDSADYYLGDMTNPKHMLNNPTFYQSVASNFRKFAEEQGIPITQTHAPFVFTGWSDPKEYEEFILPAIKRSIEVSAILGAKVCVVHPLHHFIYKGHEEEIYEKNMEFYRSLIPICKEYDIKVGIENMFQREFLRAHISFDTCATISEFIRYVDTLDSEYMVACLDIGHVGLPESDDRAWDFIRALGHERLQSLHVHDNDYRNDRHALPYQGRIDWNEVTKALGEIDYQGDFTYEVSENLYPEHMPDALVPVSVKYVADIGRYLCNQVESYRIKK
jgi:sugar phosphate isomerase/epimerase